MEKYNKLATELLTELLARRNTTIEDVRRDFPEDRTPRWFEFYTWSEKEEDEFKEYAIKLTQKRLRVGKRYATELVGMFILNYGFKRNFKEFN